MKAALRKMLARTGYEVSNTRQRLAPLVERPRRAGFEDLVCRLIYERGETLSFIQIGAFDGVTKDPLRPFIVRHPWSGVLIEPQPGPAAKLRALYAGNPRIHVLEGAVSEAAGSRTLYTLGTEDWTGGLASFDREVIIKHGVGKPGEIEVACFPFDRALDLAPAPDILQIDAEGADAYLLGLFPLERVRPSLIQFEIKHLAWDERRTTLTRLAQHGYRFALGDEDLIATLI